MRKAYFISGLGTDSSVFSRLTLDPSIEVNHLPWIQPEKKESMEHYAQRMLDRVDDPQNSTLVGLSFGGIMSVEMNKLAPFQKTILISSIKSRSEMPPLFESISRTRLHKLVPIKIILRDYPLIFYFFGVKTNEHRSRMREIIQMADPKIVRWSIDQLLEWKSTKPTENLVHIHGTSDLVFPKRYVTADHWIEKGPHFMISTRALDVSELLNKEILH